MEKAKLTREQAEALERAKETPYLGEDLHSLVMAQATRKYPDLKFNVLLDLDMDTFCRALYVGYEIIEEDQEIVITEKDRDNIRALFACESGSKQFEDGFRIGVNRVLLLLGITIKGITEKGGQP